MIYDQISSIVLSKWYFYKESNLKLKVLFPQSIIIIYAFIIILIDSDNNSINILYSDQFIVKIGIYLMLHSLIENNLISNSYKKKLDYYLSIGLSINCYYIGNFILEIIVIWVPLLFSLILVKLFYIFLEK